MKEHMFQVMEIGKGIRETYSMMMTDKEMAEYIKNKEEMNGYVKDMGGDRTYSIVAWQVGEVGQGYVDLDRLWRWHCKKIA
ncbi:MAG: hypothetical protein IJW67_11185 [Blautia sp.]|nr:hypothetical protein [Blautia sp.]